MLAIQELLIAFNLDEVISADETGFNYGALPLLQYVPQDAQRASAPESDEKARVTAMLWGVASGKMGPIFVIIKCSTKVADLTRTRVLKDLAMVDGFKPSDGWKMCTWVKTIEIKVKKDTVRRQFTCPYLIDSNLNVITIQHKVWMDTPRVCMWLDVQLGPYYCMPSSAEEPRWCGTIAARTERPHARTWRMIGGLYSSPSRRTGLWMCCR